MSSFDDEIKNRSFRNIGRVATKNNLKKLNIEWNTK